MLKETALDRLFIDFLIKCLNKKKNHREPNQKLKKTVNTLLELHEDQENPLFARKVIVHCGLLVIIKRMA